MKEIVAQVFSSATTGMRLGGELNVDLKEIQTNLVPHQQIQFLTASYAPFLPGKMISNKELHVCEITKACFEKDNQSVKCDVSAGRYIASTLT